MKTATLSIFFLIFLLTGCSPAAAPNPQPVQVTQPPTLAPTLVDTLVPTEERIPTQTLVPTPAPPPVPCMITFDTNRDGNREIYLMGPDGKDPVNLTNNPADDFEPSWSPQGSQVAFVSNRANGSGGRPVYLCDERRWQRCAAVVPRKRKQLPRLVPDGSWITYEHQGDILVIKADGGSPSTNLTNSPEQDLQPTWSPDGSRILWLSGGEGNRNIFSMNADGSQVSQLTSDGKVSDAVWTVDGQIFTHWDNREAGCFNCVMDADGSNIKDAGGKGEIQRYLPFWTLEGDRVECVSGDMNKHDNEIYLVGEIYPDIFLNLTNNPADDRNPDWPANCGPGELGTVAEQNLQPPAPGEMIIGYEGDPNSMSPQKLADLQKACTELDIQCVQGESIPKLIEQNVSAILSFSNRWHVLGTYPQIHAAVEKGIPVLILNAETSEPGAYNLSIESDAIRLGLEWMFEEMGGAGEFAYYIFGENEIHQAILDQVLQAYPGIKAVSQPSNNETDPITEQRIIDLANANPNLGGIWTDERQVDVFWGLRKCRHTTHSSHFVRTAPGYVSILEGLAE